LLAGGALAAQAQQQPAFDKEAYINAQQQVYTNTYLVSPFAEKLSAEDRMAGLSLLWSEAKFNFANFDLNLINLDSLYKSYIPRVLAVEDTYGYYQELRSFYAQLRDGHTGVAMPQELFGRAYSHPGVEASLIEGKVILSNIYPGVELPRPMVLGDEVIGINEMPVQDFIRQKVAPYTSFSTPQDSIARILRYELFFGDVTEPIRLEMKDKKGKRYTSSLNRQAPKGFFQSGLPVAEYKVLSGNIGYLSLNTFNDEQVLPFFNNRFEEISKTDGLIIDLRHNGGGNGQLGFEILGQLTDKPFMQATSLFRNFNPTKRAWGNSIELEENSWDWKPHKGRAYHKPVILLIGPSTYSAAEDFTVAFKQTRRGLIVGEATGGSTGQPYFYQLPGGGYAWVCTKRDLFNDGTDFVGTGIYPDVEVKKSLSDMQKGRDNVVEWARKKLKSGPF
jgi:carboxyl-terminal processing protease